MDKITNRFSDNNKIGEGGFSDVYLGITEKSQKKIAIKKLKIDSETEQAIMDLMNLEVEQLPRMKHPNIIDLLGMYFLRAKIINSLMVDLHQDINRIFFFLLLHIFKFF